MSFLDEFEKNAEKNRVEGESRERQRIEAIRHRELLDTQERFVDVADEANKISREANEIAKQANAKSDSANRTANHSWWVAWIAAAFLAVEVILQIASYFRGQ